MDMKDHISSKEDIVIQKILYHSCKLDYIVTWANQELTQFPLSVSDICRIDEKIILSHPSHLRFCLWEISIPPPSRPSRKKVIFCNCLECYEDCHIHINYSPLKKIIHLKCSPTQWTRVSATLFGSREQL